MFKKTVDIQKEVRKEKYRELCDREISVCLFNQAWWLDAVAQNDWDVVLVEKSGSIDAALPFKKRIKMGFVILEQPQFTRELGPWMRKNSYKYSRAIALEKDLLQDVYRSLPKFSFCSHSWNYELKNWLPLYWMGFKQTTCYTYVIEDLTNLKRVLENFEHSKRKNIKKARELITIKLDISAKEFYESHKSTLLKEGKSISYSYEIFERIYNAAYSRNSAFTIAAYDQSNNLHCALFIVRDSFSAYNLISTIDPSYRTLGASSLVVLEAIRESAKYVNRFDFEGSMIESVERSFRQFGSTQRPYFAISKSNSIIFDCILLLKKLIQ